MATPGLFKITVFWNKVYGVIITIDDVTKEILSRDSNYIVDEFMWPKFGNCSISRSYDNLNFIRIWPQKLLFLRGGLGSSSIIWDSHWTLDLHQCDKKIKNKSHRVFGTNSYVCRSYRGKNGRGEGLFGPFPSILNRVNKTKVYYKQFPGPNKTTCNSKINYFAFKNFHHFNRHRPSR